jgi:hypothetical protein
MAPVCEVTTDVVEVVVEVEVVVSPSVPATLESEDTAEEFATLIKSAP